MTTNDDSFTKVPNSFLRDQALSARAKGVFAYLLSLPPSWIIRKTEIVGHFSEGRDAIFSAFKELVDAEYLEKIYQRESDGITRPFFKIKTQNLKSRITENQVTPENPYYGKSVLTLESRITENQVTPENPHCHNNPQSCDTDFQVTPEKPNTDFQSSNKDYKGSKTVLGKRREEPPIIPQGGEVSDFDSGTGKPEMPDQKKESMKVALERLIEFYNQNRTGKMPKVIKASTALQKKLSARLKEFTIEEIKSVLETSFGNRFLRGEVIDFVANLDWILGVQNFSKILNGNYSNHQAKKGSGVKHPEAIPDEYIERFSGRAYIMGQGKPALLIKNIGWLPVDKVKDGDFVVSGDPDLNQTVFSKRSQTA